MKPITPFLSLRRSAAGRFGRRGFAARAWHRLLAMVGAFALPGCIVLSAPERPIVIELNINITQQVIYRLAEDAGTAIDENADIF